METPGTLGVVDGDSGIKPVAGGKVFSLGLGEARPRFRGLLGSVAGIKRGSELGLGASGV